MFVSSTDSASFTVNYERAKESTCLVKAAVAKIKAKSTTLTSRQKMPPMKINSVAEWLECVHFKLCPSGSSVIAEMKILSERSVFLFAV